jgi:hypothetical protein
MNHTHLAVLRVLFEMARDDRHADLVLIADELELSCVETDMLLDDLDRGGLLDAERARLTMAGLVLAVSQAAPRAQPAPDRAESRSAWRAA